MFLSVSLSSERAMRNVKKAYFLRKQLNSSRFTRRCPGDGFKDGTWNGSRVVIFDRAGSTTEDQSKAEGHTILVQFRKREIVS